MKYKLTLKVIIFHLIFIAIINLKCRDTNEIQSFNLFQNNLVIRNLSKNYSTNIAENVIEINQRNKLLIVAGEYITYETVQEIPITKIKISNSVKNQSIFSFKLYVNNKLLGRYQQSEFIKINKKVSSLKVLFVNTGNENVYNLWDEKFNYQFIKEKEEKLYVKPKVELFIINDKKYNGTINFKSKKNKFSKEKRSINNISFQKQTLTSILTNKKNGFISESSNIFLNDGRFKMHQVTSSTSSRKITKDFFYEGNWKITQSQNKLIIELSGYLSGYFATNKNKFVKSELYNISTNLNNNMVNAKGIISNFCINIPENALINIKEFAADLIVDMPYSTENNFTGVKLYPCNKCFFRYLVALDLIKANRGFNKLGLKIKLLDCYRPFYVQAIMFKQVPVKGYVADSIWGSIHNRATAVDLTLTDNTGNQLDMGTNYDELSYKSSHNYKYFSDTILKNRLLLKSVMMDNNFVPINGEWWHYNHVKARDFSKLNENFPCDN